MSPKKQPEESKLDKCTVTELRARYELLKFDLAAIRGYDVVAYGSRLAIEEEQGKILILLARRSGEKNHPLAC